jgi:hypothetical protein
VLVRFGWELPVWAIEAGVAKQYALGLHYGYPRCCVEAFCRDVIDGESPGSLRGLGGLGCVPCEACLAELDEDPRAGPQRPSAATPAPGGTPATPEPEEAF